MSFAAIRRLWAAVTLSGLVAPAVLYAQNCRPIDIAIADQGSVDRFHVLHGPCDRVAGSLFLSGAGILKLNGLSGLREVAGNLVIDDTAKLADLTGLETLNVVGQDFGLFANSELHSLKGLEGLELVKGSFGLFSNPVLADVDGLQALTEVDGFVAISDQPALQSLEGLRNLRTVGEHLLINFNDVLENLNGLRGLETVGGQLSVRLNDRLANLDGLYRMRQLGGDLDIRENARLTDLQGLAGLDSLGGNVRVRDNAALANCGALAPFAEQVADFRLRRNAEGCANVGQMLRRLAALGINPGFSDAWANSVTPGQGFFIVVFPDIGQVFLGWFTFDTQRPDSTVTALLGEAGHRWLTASGRYAGRVAELDITLTRGGLFDASEPAVINLPAGSVTLEFSSCAAGTAYFDLPDQGRSGAIPIRRLSPDNLALCEALQQTGR